MSAQRALHVLDVVLVLVVVIDEPFKKKLSFFLSSSILCVK